MNGRLHESLIIPEKSSRKKTSGIPAAAAACLRFFSTISGLGRYHLLFGGEPVGQAGDLIGAQPVFEARHGAAAVVDDIG